MIEINRPIIWVASAVMLYLAWYFYEKTKTLRGAG